MAFICKRKYLGLELENSYNIIQNTSSFKDKGDCTLQVYVSEDAYKDGNSYLFTEQFDFPSNFGESEGSDRYQAYMHLMTLEQFKDAKLILDDEFKEGI